MIRRVRNFLGRVLGRAMFVTGFVFSHGVSPIASLAAWRLNGPVTSGFRLPALLMGRHMRRGQHPAVTRLPMFGDA
ncbi:hypothetical protein BQ8482_30066 [Mesorhizobium delmotii]|uniref:Uncharacterized protein n=1 Tax=Mesorhizobium delmotii TaxID=1631247 RepID=A0A2P9AN69_9HYPH|nr:hypothetical protein BQ8482_30066 [Mesorhizobium delmotii]